MHNIPNRILVMSILTLCLIMASCSKPTPPAEEAPASTAKVPSPAETGVSGDAAAPAPAAAQEPTAYDSPVVRETTEGSIQYNIIKSAFPCSGASDCTSTKYANIPKSANDCECAAACTPFVVNVEEMKRRKESNEKFCKASDWYGPSCPAPDCSFMEFDRFKCINGVCLAEALGKR